MTRPPRSFNLNKLSRQFFVTPKFKDKFEYNNPHVRPRNSRAHKSTNYKSIIISVLHNVYYNTNIKVWHKPK